eukprot:5271643-Pleurochrysis_carterae.AAC.1
MSIEAEVVGMESICVPSSTTRGTIPSLAPSLCSVPPPQAASRSARSNRCSLAAQGGAHARNTRRAHTQVDSVEPHARRHACTGIDLLV